MIFVVSLVSGFHGVCLTRFLLVVYQECNVHAITTPYYVLASPDPPAYSVTAKCQLHQPTIPSGQDHDFRHSFGPMMASTSRRVLCWQRKVWMQQHDGGITLKLIIREVLQISCSRP